MVLAAVVNTEGLLVRTSIYEGNRHDSTTLKDVVGFVSTDLVSGARRIVVMDAGFYSEENVRWLTDNGFDYITEGQGTAPPYRLFVLLRNFLQKYFALSTISVNFAAV